MTLFVRTSAEDITGWDRRKIVDALIREAGVDLATAEEISREVADRIASSGIDILTSALIRELVDARLIERGMKEATKLHARLGFPLYDVGRLILYRNKENANIPHSPEGTNLTLAQGIQKRICDPHGIFGGCGIRPQWEGISISITWAMWTGRTVPASPSNISRNSG